MFKTLLGKLMPVMNDSAKGAFIGFTMSSINVSIVWSYINYVKNKPITPL